MNNSKTRKVHEWTTEGKSRIDAKNLERREQTDAKYRQKFSELGIEGFEYVRFESKEKIYFKCLKCGSLFSKCNDLFKGKQSKLICRNCRNGEIAYSELADKVLKYYAEGHTDAETISKFGISENRLKDWAKRRGVSNGRKFGESSNDVRIRKSESEARRNAELLGYTIFGVWQGAKHEYTIINNKTGFFEKARGASFLSSAKPSYHDNKRRNIKTVDKGITIFKLIERDGNKCYICGKETDFQDKRWGSFGPDYPTKDHVVPVKHGGTHSWSNLRVCCARCNLRKGAKYEETTK